MRFTERNYPPPTPSGEAIPDGVRTSLLTWLAAEHYASATTLWEQFLQYEGYASYEEIAGDIGRRFGEEHGDRFRRYMVANAEQKRRRSVWSQGVNYDAAAGLLAIHAVQFLDILESALDGRYSYSCEPAVEEFNRLLAKRGVNYRFGYDGKAVWHGDEGVYDVAVRPALDVLRDTRLAGAASEFHAALLHLRAAGSKDLEDAIEESAKAVESAMKVLLRARAIKTTGKETAQPLFDLLEKNEVLPKQADRAILAASRLRNEYGGHGSGAVPRVVPLDVAELSVRCAAVAIAYLAKRLAGSKSDRAPAT